MSFSYNEYVLYQLIGMTFLTGYEDCFKLYVQIPCRA